MACSPSISPSRLYSVVSRILLIGAAALLLLGSCRQHPVPPAPGGVPRIAIRSFVRGLDRPVHITNAGDGSGRLFVVEQGGLIKIVRNGTVLHAPFLDVSSLLKSGSGEQGLLSVAFPPAYGPEKPHFYIDYTGTQGVGDTVVARYSTTADPDVADPSSGREILTIAQPFTNHNGGLLLFGRDGYLYIGTGDGGSGGDPFGNARNPRSLLGKILRIDVESGSGPYGIPPDNPFVNDASRRPELWASGLRNPWRFSFDSATGELYIADVGQDSYEEVDHEPASSAGGNDYGWNIMEGSHCYPAGTCDTSGLVPPIAEYDHSSGDCSVTGGTVYRGRELPGLRGLYLYGDYCSGRIRGAIRRGDTWETMLLLESGLLISTFGEDEAGELYVADHGSGVIYRITAPASAK